jgi:hypothetical protein
VATFWRWFRRILGLTVAVAISATLLVMRPAVADPAVVQLIGDGGTATGSGVTITQTRSSIELRPGQATTRGFIFYPGGLVDPRAYVAMLEPIAAQGWFVEVVKVPFDLAIINASAGDAVIDEHPEITTWAVGGHSLGGVAAASLLSADPSRVPNLVLWASYPLADLSEIPDIEALSVSASNDGLSTPQDIAESEARLPPDTTFVVVEGAVHAFFGDYGPQDGDGEPTVSREAAQEEIVRATVQWLNSVAPAG